MEYTKELSFTLTPELQKEYALTLLRSIVSVALNTANVVCYAIWSAWPETADAALQSVLYPCCDMAKNSYFKQAKTWILLDAQMSHGNVDKCYVAAIVKFATDVVLIDDFISQRPARESSDSVRW